MLTEKKKQLVLDFDSACLRDITKDNRKFVSNNY